MLGVDGACSGHSRLGHRKLENRSGPRRVGQLVVGRRRAASKHCLPQHFSQLLAIHSEDVENNAGGRRWRSAISAGIGEQREQKVLGTDVLVTQARCLFASLAEHIPQPFRELESVQRLSVLVFSNRLWYLASSHKALDPHYHILAVRVIRYSRSMSNLLAARSQMAVSLAFHIVFAEVGIAMPLMMTIAEWRWLRTGERVYLELAKRWAKGTAILFAVGAVSGTVLSFELGLLWPNFMRFAGSIIGMPFSLEGFAFFAEAIFLGVYLYGWDRVPPRSHLVAGGLVALSGAASGIFVVIANAWMNAPAGFRIVDGQPVDIDPISAMANRAALSQTLHMTIAAYASTALAVAGIHSFVLLRQGEALTATLTRFHRAALAVTLSIGIPAAILQPLSGDISARFVARVQPVKLAAMEGIFATEQGAPLRIGGWPNETERRTRFAIEIPKALSLLAYHDPDAVVRGLNDFPREDWPPVKVVHVCFQLMVALGSMMAMVAIWAGFVLLRQRSLELPSTHYWLRIALAIIGPFGFLATEAGWFTTEVGRQPWVIFGVLRTSDAVTPMPGLMLPFLTVTLLYCGLGAVVVWLLWRQIIKTAGDPSGSSRGAAPGVQ